MYNTHFFQISGFRAIFLIKNNANMINAKSLPRSAQYHLKCTFSFPCWSNKCQHRSVILAQTLARTLEREVKCGVRNPGINHKNLPSKFSITFCLLILVKKAGVLRREMVVVPIIGVCPVKKLSKSVFPTNENVAVKGCILKFIAKTFYYIRVNNIFNSDQFSQYNFKKGLNFKLYSPVPKRGFPKIVWGPGANRQISWYGGSHKKPLLIVLSLSYSNHIIPRSNAVYSFNPHLSISTLTDFSTC